MYTATSAHGIQTTKTGDPLSGYIIDTGFTSDSSASLAPSASFATRVERAAAPLASLIFAT
eukprot:8996142-Pyramimonas_sp.AAC.2